MSCKTNERVSLNQPETIEEFARLGIVALQADWTKRDTLIKRTLTKYGRISVPLVLYFPPNGGEVVVLAELLPGPGSVLGPIREANAKAPAAPVRDEDPPVATEAYQDLDEARQVANVPDGARPVFVDFTGHNCPNCRINERKVFPDRRVQELFRQVVTVELWHEAGRHATDEQAEHAREMEEQYGVIGQPTYLFVDAETGEELSRLEGKTTIKAFTAFMESGIAAATRE